MSCTSFRPHISGCSNRFTCSHLLLHSHCGSFRRWCVRLAGYKRKKIIKTGVFSNTYCCGHVLSCHGHVVVNFSLLSGTALVWVWLWHAVNTSSWTFWLILSINAALETRLLNTSFGGVRCNWRRFETRINEFTPASTLFLKSAENNC